MRSQESFPPFPAASGTSTDITKIGAVNTVSNPLTATTGPFTLTGGKYQFVCRAGNWNSGTVALQRQSPDGVGFLSVATGLTSDGISVVDLAPGQYEVNFSTTGMTIYVELTRIDEE